MQQAISRLTLAIVLGALSCSITLTEQILMPGERHLFGPFDDRVVRKNVEITLEDGQTLRGWHLVQPEAQRTVVYFYGNGGRVLTSIARMYALAATLQANVVCLDYRGYGFSDGKPSLLAGAKDALAVVDRARTLEPTGLPLMVVGHSLGTVFATYAAARRDLDAVILLAPPTSIKGVAAAWDDKLPWFADIFFSITADPKLVAMKEQPIAEVTRVEEPLLVVHGTADRVIPFKMGRAMYRRAASSKKQFCDIRGAGHNLSFVRVPKVRACIKPFVESL